MPWNSEPSATLRSATRSGSRSSTSSPVGSFASRAAQPDRHRLEPPRPPPRRPGGRRADHPAPLQWRRPPPYVHLDRDALRRPRAPAPSPSRSRRCSCAPHNSARSQLAAALWRSAHRTRRRRAPAPTPPRRVHPGPSPPLGEPASTSSGAAPRSLDDVTAPPALVVTVCDRAHEELDAPTDAGCTGRSPIPSPTATAAAFDAHRRASCGDRITGLVAGAS